MRVTNKMLSDNYLNDMQTNLNNLRKIQQQITTQSNFSRPSDAPFDVSISMQMQSAINANTQYGKNITNTKNWMESTDTALGQIGDIYKKIRDDLIKAGGAPYRSDDMEKLKDEINQYISSISEILNSNSQGAFIFGGTKSSSKPVSVQNNYIVTKSNADGGDINVSEATNSTLSSDTMYRITVNSVDSSGNVTNITCERSSDGGKNWPNVNSNLAVTSNSITLPDGFTTIKFNPSLNTNNTTKDTYVFSLVKNTQLTYNSSDNQAVQSLPAVISSGNFNKDNWAGKDITFNVNGSSKDSKITLDFSNTPSTTIDDVVKNINDKITANSDLKGKVFVQKTSDNKIRFDTLTNDIVFLKDSTVSDLPVLLANPKKQLPNIQLSQIDSTRQTEISQGVLVKYNVSASDVINYGNGNKDNIMDLFKRIINNLDGKDDAGIENNDAARKSLANEDLADLDKAITQILKVRSDVGSVENRMTAAQNQNTDSNTNMTDVLSKTKNIDITKVIMEYATAQTVYLASLQTSAKIIEPTLMDYIR